MGCVLNVSPFLQLLYSSDINDTLRSCFHFWRIYHQNTSDSDSITWHTFVYVISVAYQRICSCDLSCWDLLWILLYLHVLAIINQAFRQRNIWIWRTFLVISILTRASHWNIGKLARLNWNFPH